MSSIFGNALKPLWLPASRAGWVARKRNPSTACAGAMDIASAFARGASADRSLHPILHASIAVRPPAIAVVASCPRPHAVGHGQRRPRRIFIVVFLRRVALPGVVTLGIGGRTVDIDRPRGVARSVLAIDRCRCTVSGARRIIRGLPISVTGLRVRRLPIARSRTHIDISGRRVDSAGRHVDGRQVAGRAGRRGQDNERQCQR